MTNRMKMKFLSQTICRRFRNQSDRWSGCYYSLLCLVSYNALALTVAHIQLSKVLYQKSILIGLVTDSSKVSSIIQVFFICTNNTTASLCAHPGVHSASSNWWGALQKSGEHSKNVPHTFSLLLAPLYTLIYAQ